MSASPFASPDELKLHASMVGDLHATERELGMRSFRDFHQMSWHVIEPGMPLIPNWHLDAITDHGQAVAKGDIKNLVINLPPRNTKTTPISVQLHPWIWTWKPSEQIIGASYGQSLAERDSRKSRMLIQSDWYQKRWGASFRLSEDQNTKKRYENNKNGSRQAMSVEKGTGEGGDLILIDDPHDVHEANSPTVMANTILWWRETMTTRHNDAKTGRFIIIMQRVHESDLSGHVLANELGWEHLNLPARFEGKCAVEVTHSCSQTVIAPNEANDNKKEEVHTSGTSLGFKDPRTKDGELLNPIRFPEEVLQRIERKLGAHAAAGQLAQRPGPRGGNLFMMDRVNLVREVPPGLVSICRGWDKAATKDGKRVGSAKAHSAGVKIGRYANGRFIFLHAVSGAWSSHEREQRIRSCAIADGDECSIIHEQEPGSGGKDSALATSRNLAEFDVTSKTATGSKATRADAMSRAIERGDFDMVEGSWNQSFVDEMQLWPASTRLDQGDAAATAYNKIALGGIGFADLYPADDAENSSDGLKFYYEDEAEHDEEGGDVWATA